MTLIDLNDPKNAASRGDVPEAVRYLVEVPYCVGVLEPPIIRCHPLGSFFENPFAGKGFATADDVAGNKVEHFRPATKAEIEKHCTVLPLAFGRYVVEGGKAYEVRDLIDEGCWLKDGDVEIDASKVKRPLPSTPATYALLQAAWVEHFGVKVGTRVRVVRKAVGEELGWLDGWIDDMDDMLGGNFPITRIAPNGIAVNNEWSFPFHVLEVLPEPTAAKTIDETLAEGMRHAAEKWMNQPVPAWSVTVQVAGEAVLRIDPQSLGGKDPLSDTEEAAIREAGESVLGFIGRTTAEPAPVAAGRGQ